MSNFYWNKKIPVAFKCKVTGIGKNTILLLFYTAE